MVDAKKDASTDIEAVVEAFCKSLNAELATWREEVIEDEGDAFGSAKEPGKAYLPEVTFKLSKNKVSKVRTPEDQALEVARGKSWVCWGAHMSDKARHVLMTADGKTSWDSKKAFATHFDDFKRKWAEHMKKHGLLNYQSKDGYGDGDAFHLELPDARIDHGDKRAKACLEEYVRPTRTEDYEQNEKFEGKYEKLLAPYIEEYEDE